MLISTLLDVLYEKTIWFGRQKYWLLVLGLVFTIVVLINGIGIVPEEAYRRLSQNPFNTRTDIHLLNYWQETLLLPIVAYYLHLTSSLTFNLFCFIIIASIYLLFAILTSRRWNSYLALISTTLLITSPLTTILLAWLGMPDGLTVLFTIPFLFTQSLPIIFGLAILGATNHPIFIVAIMEILTLRWLARDDIKPKHIVLVATGSALGYGLVKFFLTVNGIEVSSRLDFILSKNLDGWIRMNISNLPISIFSLFNIHWLIFPVCFVMFYKRNRLFYSLAGLMLFLNYGITFFTLDTTRVFILLSWGILFQYIFQSYKLSVTDYRNEPKYKKQFLQALTLIGIASFITPRYFAWVGEIHITPFYELLSRIF